MSSQETVIRDLEIIWNNFIKKEDDNEKIPWVRLFLYKFQSLDQNNLSIGTATFLNSVAYQLTCFMLQLIYGIISDSLANNDTSIEANDSEKQSQENNKTDFIFPQLIYDDMDFSYENCSLSKLILGTPEDITAIIALRKFLTNGLGGKILDFLQNCDIKFLTSRKIFCLLLINLFPNTFWDKNISPKALIKLMKHFNPPMSINTFVQEFTLLKLTQNNKTLFNKLNPLNFENVQDEKLQKSLIQRDHFIPIYNDDLENYEIKEIVYDECDFELFLKYSKTSDQIAYLLLHLLIIVVKDENGLNLDEYSITMNCFQFALDALDSINKITQIPENNYLLKLKCLNLIEISLNNFFVNRNNYELIDFQKIFNQVYKVLIEVSCRSEIALEDLATEELKLEFTLEAIFLNFALLNNFIVNAKLDKSIELLDMIGEQQFNNIIEILKKCLQLNQSNVNYFKKFIQVQFQIISNIKLFNSTKSSGNKYKTDAKQNAKKKQWKKKNKKFQSVQGHCKKNKLPCLFEKIIINIFSNLNIELQEIILKQFQKNAFCCCLYNLENLNIMMLNEYDLIIQKKIYKFIGLRFLKTICSKNQCKLCEEKGKLFEFHENLFQIYKRKFLNCNTSAELLLFLKHLLKISNLISFEIGSKIIIDIALPIFRTKKQYVMDIVNGKSLTEHDDESKNDYFNVLNVILECINIFTSYLNDIRLIKAFFNAENIHHLNDLIVIPELLKSIFDLIKIGLENSTFLGYNYDEQILLNDKLINLQLNSVEYCTFVIMDLIKDINSCQTNCTKNKNALNKSNPINNLYVNKKLSISQILYMATINWNLVADLYRKQKYRKYFCEKYFETKNDEEADELENQFLFNIVYNVLNAFLYYHHEIECNIRKPDSTIYFKTKLDYNFNSSNMENNFKTPKSILFNSVDMISNENYVLEPHGCLKIFTQEDNYNKYFKSDNDNELFYYGYSSDNSTFLNSLISQHLDEENEITIFDIRRTVNKISKSDSNNIVHRNENELFSIFTTLYDYTVNIFKNSFLNNFIDLNNLFYYNNKTKSVENSHNTEEKKLNDDHLYLCQNGEGKGNLLKLFESTLKVFIMDNFDLQDNKMQEYLNLLKSLILLNATNFWDHIENSNLIIQAVQSLIKVAEMVNKSVENNPKTLRIQLSNNEPNQESGSISDTLYDEEDQPALQFTGRISFGNGAEEFDFQSSKATCSQESEIELSENDTEEYYLTADEGYEADAEIQDNSDNSNLKEIFNSYIQSSRFRKNIVHNGLCKIIIGILIELSKKCIDNPNFWVNSLVQLANRLFAIRQCLGGSLFLLKGFAPLLKCNDERLQEFQQGILDLITDLNTPDVLSAYLTIMASENPPIELLMRYMGYICINSIRFQPKVELVFPTTIDNSIHSTCNPLLFDQIDKIRNYHEFHGLDSPFTQSACILPITHAKTWTSDGFTLSTWLQIKPKLIYSKLNNSEQTIERNEPTHIISFGSNQIMLSVYVNNNLNLIFETSKPNDEISSHDNQNNSIPTNLCKSGTNIKKIKKFADVKCASINSQYQSTASNKENCPPSVSLINKNEPNTSEKSSITNAFKNTKQVILNSFNIFQQNSELEFEPNSIELKYYHFIPNKWTHLCISVDIKLDQLNITVTINGFEQHTLALSCKNLLNLIKNESFQVACLGQINCKTNLQPVISSDLLIQYGISNLLIFDNSFSNRSIIANLTALGPDATNLSQCQIGNVVPNFSNIKNVSKFNAEGFLDTIRLLKSRLIVTYSPFEPFVFNGFERRLDNSEPNGCNFGLISFGTNLKTKPIPSLQTATILCGGLSSLLFLFARVVDLKADSITQALALDMFLHVALSDTVLYTEFVKKNSLNLIHYVIRTDQCSKDINLLKSVINNSCTEPILIERNDTMHIHENTCGCITYPHILISVLRRYCDWYRSGSKNSKVLDCLLRCIQSLIRDKHPYQLFNIQQLNSAGLIKEMLNLCKIYIIESPNPVYISSESADLFVQILSTFAGSPPLPSMLDEIMKLLLLLQRPSECYVTDDRSKIYFLVTSNQPLRQKKISLPLPSRHLRHLIKERKKSTPSNLSTPQSIQRRSMSKERESLDKIHPTFSRNSLERQPANLSNILNNVDTLDSIADCSKLTPSIRKSLNLTSNIIKAASCSVSGKSRPLQKHRIRHNSSQENKNRVQKVSKNKIRLAKSTTDIDGNIKNKKTNFSLKSENSDISSSELNILFDNEYDVVNYDEILSIEKKGSNKVKKTEFHNFPGIIKLQENLFLLLRDFILILPDNTVEEVLTHYVKIEILIVLANHENAIVRTAIIRLLAAVCARAHPNELQALSKKFYWHHLANQISTNYADYDLCEALVQWITGKVHRLDDILLMDDIKIINRYGIQSFLAIQTKLVNSSEIASKCFQFLTNLYEKDVSNNLLLIDYAILQVSCRVLNKIYMNLKSFNFKLEQNIILLLTVIAERSFKSSGQINILWDIMNLLTYYQECNLSNVTFGFRSVQAKVLLCLLDLYTIPTSPGGRQKVSSPVLPNAHLSLNEMKTRFDLLNDRTVQFFIASDSSGKPSEIEIKLFERMVSFGTSGTGTMRSNNFLFWGLLPSRPIELRIFIVNSLWQLIQQNNTISCDSRILRSLLWVFLKENKSELNSWEHLLKLCKHLNIHENDSMNVENEMEKIEMNRENLIMKQKPVIEKIIYRYEAMAQSLIDSSMTITRVIAELQNSERKILMCQMKERDESYVFQEWISLIERMTHEGAPWFNDSFFSKSWELDDTEGPGRARSRLKRCSLNLDSRFIMEEYQSKDKIKYHPLDYLIGNRDHQMNITLNSQILYNFPAKYLPVDGEIDGELVITDFKIYFLATYRCKFFHRCCDINRITEIWPKRFQHQECAIEIFLDSSRSLFFALQNLEDFKTIKDIFYDKIMQMPDQNKILSIAHDWRDGLLTNWEYLMALNQISGRTYNDLMQYPIFPWILSNYTSDQLDLTDQNNFRKLEKPIAIQHEEKEAHYISNYAYLNSTSTSFGSIELKPYHFSSHYSNSGTVLHFLVRVPPFTSYFLRYQDNNFDLPDRTFHSLNTTWCLASRDSATDVKELVPEFFCLPEMFENFEKLNFGNRQSGEIVSNVQLPAWCSNDARLFVLIHRQALESEYVRYNLHNWIDLIFGYKQTGSAAVSAINVFHPATYPDFLSSKVTDPIERKAVETMVKTYGQMPKQLLKTAHPTSKSFNYQPCKLQPISTVVGLKWGAYTGSPQLPEPELVNVYKLIGIAQLIPFQSTNVIYGLPKKCCVMSSAESDVFHIISWTHDDRLIRIQTLNEYNNMNQLKPLIYNDYFDEITTCGANTNSNTLWLGRKSGRISVHECVASRSKFLRTRRSNSSVIKLSYNSAFRKFSLKGHQKLEELENIHKDIHHLETSEEISWVGPINLIRHTDEVTCITLSFDLKIAVSAAKDGLAVIWDLNSFNYIRTIERPSEINHSPISLVLVSPSLGDILTVHSIDEQFFGKNKKLDDECFEATEENLDGFINININPNGKSILRLHSINAKYINHVIHEEKILCACYSNLKEGIGINVIATAFEGGSIRFWSSWNLSFVKEFNIGGPEIISLTFSTYQYLVTLTKEGYIKVWKSDGLLGNPPKFPQIIFNK